MFADVVVRQGPFSGDVFPCLTTNDLADDSSPDMKVSSNFPVKVSHSATTADLSDGIFGESGSVMAFAARHLFFDHSIGLVVHVCTEEQVVRVHAGRIISPRTVVQNMQPIRDRTVSKLPRDTMSAESALDAASNYHPVSFFVGRTSPQKAAGFRGQDGFSFQLNVKRNSLEFVFAAIGTKSPTILCDGRWVGEKDVAAMKAGTINHAGPRYRFSVPERGVDASRSTYFIG